ncbi:MAG: SIS domain-containing protein [Treponema sp.]|nr:SIS domain-containing protein [Treponema sp.]
MKTDSWKQLISAFDTEAGAVSLMGEFAGGHRDAFDKVVSVLAHTPRIGASGCGHTGIACRHFAHLMCCIERPARFIPPSEAVHGAAGFLQKGDAMLLASRGGKTSELIPILNICKRRNVTVIGFTENPDSVLAKDADIFLPLKITKEVDKYNTQGTTSFVVMCAVFDAIQAALIEETDFHTDTFSIVHPGGAVGERLGKEKSLGKRGLV